MNFGERLKELRQEKGITLRKLGEKACISYSILNAIEKNTFQPSKEIIISIAYALKYENVDELLGIAGYASGKEPQLKPYKP